MKLLFPTALLVAATLTAGTATARPLPDPTTAPPTKKAGWLSKLLPKRRNAESPYARAVRRNELFRTASK